MNFMRNRLACFCGKRRRHYAVGGATGHKDNYGYEEDLDWPHTGNEPVSNKKKWGMNN